MQNDLVTKGHILSFLIRALTAEVFSTLDGWTNRDRHTDTLKKRKSEI